MEVSFDTFVVPHSKCALFVYTYKSLFTYTGLGGRYVGSVKRDVDIYIYMKSDLDIDIKRELYAYMGKE